MTYICLATILPRLCRSRKKVAKRLRRLPERVGINRNRPERGRTRNRFRVNNLSRNPLSRDVYVSPPKNAV